jgi:ribosomal protein S12 methylthiotransferase
VDSEELAGRLEAAGWELVENAEDADVAVVNTCGFVEQAKQDSINTLLEAAELRDGPARTQAVVAVGCLAERYGQDLAAELPEVNAILGFDSYATLSSRLNDILHGERPASHVPRDRRTLLPLAPAARRAAAEAAASAAAPVAAKAEEVTDNGLEAGLAKFSQVTASPELSAPDLPEGLAPASGPRVMRRRLDGRPWAPLKLASGCDRRCAFCAIPAFRGAFLSRRPSDVLAEARWLAERDVAELFLVSENSTSYGKDLGDLRLLETMLPEFAAVPGVGRVRVSYLQPAELRPGLMQAIANTPGVAPYFDLSFQHASTPVLRRMRRFGGTDDFLALLERIRAIAPSAGVRSNVIVGFPGETPEDVDELVRFLEAARLDVIGVFGYSDEDGTEAAGLEGKLTQDEIDARVARVTTLAEELTAQRAEERIGELVDVLIEGQDEDDPTIAIGRSAHQGPEVDGMTLLPGTQAVPGQFVTALVVASAGVDLIAEPVQQSSIDRQRAGQDAGASSAPSADHALEPSLSQPADATSR